MTSAAILFLLAAQTGTAANPGQGTATDPAKKAEAPKEAAKVEMKIKTTKAGEGEAVKQYDIIEVDYTGTLLDGKKFDSSIGRAPFTVVIGTGSVIKGWDEGIIGMKPGETRQLTIPPDMAYGKQGAGDLIPPDSTLIFEVTLRKILKATKVEILKEGEGPGSKVGDVLGIRFKGTVVQTGKEFQNNLSADEPAFRFQLGGSLFPGFTQGLIGMKLKEKRKITVAAESAFGKQQVPAKDEGNVKAGSVIPKNADLVFEIELVRLDKS